MEDFLPIINPVLNREVFVLTHFVDFLNQPHKKWVKRDLRFDGTLLVCLEDKRFTAETNLSTDKPDLTGGHLHFKPALSEMVKHWHRSIPLPSDELSKTPASSFPLLATPWRWLSYWTGQNDNKLASLSSDKRPFKHYQLPLWTLSIDDIVKVGVQTFPHSSKKRRSFSLSFSILTKNQDDITIKAQNEEDFAMWLFVLRQAGRRTLPVDHTQYNKINNNENESRFKIGRTTSETLPPSELKRRAWSESSLHPGNRNETSQALHPLPALPVLSPQDQEPNRGIILEPRPLSMVLQAALRKQELQPQSFSSQKHLINANRTIFNAIPLQPDAFDFMKTDPHRPFQENNGNPENIAIRRKQRKLKPIRVPDLRNKKSEKPMSMVRSDSHQYNIAVTSKKSGPSNPIDSDVRNVVQEVHSPSNDKATQHLVRFRVVSNTVHETENHLGETPPKPKELAQKEKELTPFVSLTNLAVSRVRTSSAIQQHVTTSENKSDDKESLQTVKTSTPKIEDLVASSVVGSALSQLKSAVRPERVTSKKAVQELQQNEMDLEHLYAPFHAIEEQHVSTLKLSLLVKQKQNVPTSSTNSAVRNQLPERLDSSSVRILSLHPPKPKRGTSKHFSTSSDPTVVTQIDSSNLLGIKENDYPVRNSSIENRDMRVSSKSSTRPVSFPKVTSTPIVRRKRGGSIHELIRQREEEYDASEISVHEMWVAVGLA